MDKMTKNEELIKEIKDKISYMAPELINLITAEGRYKLDVEFEVKNSSIKSISLGNAYKMLQELQPLHKWTDYIFNNNYLAIRNVNKQVLSGKVIHFDKKEKE